MSHTDKDRPRWVMENDPTLPRYIDHNHILFGTPVYRRVHLYDEEGEPIMATHSWNERRLDYVKAAHAGYFTIKDRTERAEFEKEFWKDISSISKGEYRYHAYETVLFYTYADHCTAGVPSHTRGPRGYGDVGLPCTYALDSVHWSYGYGSTRAGAQRINRRIKNKRNRAHTRDRLKNYIKEVNTVEDYEEDINYDRIPDTIYPIPTWADYD